MTKAFIDHVPSGKATHSNSAMTQSSSHARATPWLIAPGASNNSWSPSGCRAKPAAALYGLCRGSFSSTARSETASDRRCVNIDFPLRPVLLRFAIRRSCDGRGSQLLKDSVLNNALSDDRPRGTLEARDRIRNGQSKNALSATGFFSRFSLR